MALAVEENVEDVLRVRVVHDPAGGEHLVLALVQVLPEGRLLGLLDLDFDAEVLLPHLDHRLDVVARGGAGADLADGILGRPLAPP